MVTTLPDLLALLDPQPLKAAVKTLVRSGDAEFNAFTCALDFLRADLHNQVRKAWGVTTGRQHYLFPFSTDLVVWVYDKVCRNKKTPFDWVLPEALVLSVLTTYLGNHDVAAVNGVEANNFEWLRVASMRVDLVEQTRTHWVDVHASQVYVDHFPLSADGVVLVYAALRDYTPEQLAEWKGVLLERFPKPPPAAAS